MAHKFNPENKDKLLSQERYNNLPPQKTLQQLMLQPEDTVLDIGCGVGFFSIPAAKMIHQQEKVYAVDIAEEMLAEVNKRIEEEEIDNLETMLDTQVEQQLEDTVVNYILLSNVLHEVPDKKQFLTDYLSFLSPAGRLAVIEWKKQAEASGPPQDHRLSSQEIKELMTDLGLTVQQEVDLNPHQLGIVGQK